MVRHELKVLLERCAFSLMHRPKVLLALLVAEVAILALAACPQALGLFCAVRTDVLDVLFVDYHPQWLLHLHDKFTCLHVLFCCEIPSSGFALVDFEVWIVE